MREVECRKPPKVGDYIVCHSEDMPRTLVEGVTKTPMAVRTGRLSMVTLSGYGTWLFGRCCRTIRKVP